MRVKKPKRYENKAYLAHVRDLGCFCFDDADSHHLKTKGSGGSDLTCVPLCRRHHSEIHQIGREKFEKKYSVDLDETRIECLESFIEEQELDL